MERLVPMRLPTRRALTRPKCAAAISFSLRKFRTRPPSAIPTTAEIFRRCSKPRAFRRCRLRRILLRGRRRRRNKAELRGIGIGCYLEIAGAFPEKRRAITFPGQQEGRGQCRRRRQRGPRAIRPYFPRLRRGVSVSMHQQCRRCRPANSNATCPASRGGVAARRRDSRARRLHRALPLELGAGEGQTRRRHACFRYAGSRC